MNGVVLVTCAIVILAVAYRFYGKWLAKTWGIDPNALTPAHRLEDGQDYTPSSKFTVFANQFSSITGAGPVTGSDHRRRVRLAAGLLMAYDRRRLLRRCPGLCRSLCVHEE